MNEELKTALLENGLAEYIELFEKEKLLSFEDIVDLNKDDFKELGINALGDRKKLMTLIKSSSLDNGNEAPISIYEKSNTTDKSNEQYAQNKKEQSSQPMVVVTNSGGSENASHTGLAGILGGVIGAFAVIVIILIILSNESWTL